jgi:TnsA endonuclease N terminal
VRRIPLSRRSHVAGFQIVAASATEHESALERDFVTLATFTDASARIIPQPVTIPFRDGEVARRYTPDFLIHWSSGRSELVEVKYRADLYLHWEHLRPAFVAARAWAKAHDARFRIATDRSIRSPLLLNAKRLLPLRAAHLDPVVSIKICEAMATLSEPMLGTLVEAVQVERAEALGAIWRMIARGALRMELTTPISMNARVALP